jgi:hypothetical protein
VAVCAVKWRCATLAVCALSCQRTVIAPSYSQVSGPEHDLHSGIDGGVGNEPLMDLMGVVSGLLDVRRLQWLLSFHSQRAATVLDAWLLMTQPSTGEVLVPEFYADLRPVKPAELALYDVRSGGL